MASPSTSRVVSSLLSLMSRFRGASDSLSRLYNRSAAIDSAFGASDSSRLGFRGLPNWQSFPCRVHGLGLGNGLQSATGRILAGGQQVRNIFVEVKGNDLERAIRKWRRKCKLENLKALKDREYFTKPSEKRVLALKERDHRIARRAFKYKLNWILNRRQRGF